MALDTTYVAQYGNTWWCHKCNVEVHPPTSLLSTTSSDNRCNDKHPWWRIWYYTLIDWRELSYCCNSWKVSFNFTMFSDKKMCALLLERAFEHILEVISILDDGLVTLILDWLAWIVWLLHLLNSKFQFYHSFKWENACLTTGASLRHFRWIRCSWTLGRVCMSHKLLRR